MFSRKEEDELLGRIANWRRVYRSAQRILAVPYYTPPVAGETMQSEVIIKIPLNIQDGVVLEKTWRNLDNLGYKWYLKYQYISALKPQVIWRKLKNYHVRIRSDEEHDSFDKKALEYFYKNL